MTKKQEINWKGVKTCLDTLNLKPNFAALARASGIDPRTAKKRYEGISNKERKERSSKLDVYFETIKEKLSIPGVTMKAVYMFIKSNIDDDIGSYSNFRKYVNKHEELFKTKEETAHVLFETDYGKQLQFDWKGPMTLHFKNGEEIKFYIFSTTLSASRFHTFIYSNFMTRESVERCLIETFQILGGVPEECLTDNMSSIVNYSQHDFVPEFKAFAKDMGFQAKHCKVRHCYTKGKDESCNRFMNWLLPYDNELETEEQLKEIIKNIANKTNTEVNQSTNMPPVALFMKEKEYLQSLPNQNIIDNYLDTLMPVKVQNTMLIYYKGCRYSVPKKYINQTVKVKESDNKLYIYYNKDLIAVHEITNKKINYRQEDYLEGLSSVINNKEQNDIEKLAEHNLELLGKITK